MMLNLKVVKIDSKIIISLHYSNGCDNWCNLYTEMVGGIEVEQQILCLNKSMLIKLTPRRRRRRMAYIFILSSPLPQLYTLDYLMFFRELKYRYFIAHIVQD